MNTHTRDLLRELEHSLSHWRAQATLAFPESDRGRSDVIEQQILFENWLKRPHWNLRREAVALLYGIDPERWPDALAEPAVAAAEARLWEWMNAGDGDARPRLDNPAVEAEQWQVAPAAAANWWRAAGMAVPEAMDMLLQFILKAVAPAPATPTAEAGAADGQSNERILGAALNVLSKWPDRCRDEFGFADAGRILALVRQHAVLWFDQPDLPVEEEAALELLERWLQ